MAIDFVYEDENKFCEESFERQFYEIIETTLKHLGIEDDVELSCILVDDQRSIKSIRIIVILIVLQM